MISWRSEGKFRNENFISRTTEKRGNCRIKEACYEFNCNVWMILVALFVMVMGLGVAGFGIIYVLLKNVGYPCGWPVIVSSSN